jgi:hypothetical protein
MKIREYETWRWYDWPTYILPAVLITWGAIWFVGWGAEYTLPERLPALLVPAGWWLGVALLLRSREAYARRVVGMTDQGVSVVAWNDEARLWIVEVTHLIAPAVMEVMGWWSMTALGKFKAATIEDFFNGLAIEVTVREKPLEDRKHGVKGRGLTYPKRCIVQVTKVDLGPAFWHLLKHELSHACEDALLVPQARQEETMKALGCPWA